MATNMPGRVYSATLDRPVTALASLGSQLRFHTRTLLSTPVALRRYPREVVRLLGQVTFGSGALAVIGGTVGVMVSLSLFTGAVVGLQGYSALNAVGTAPLTGFLSAYFNTREIAPLVAGLALAATVGCGFTAQLGSMRISEEIDALEVMAVRSVPFLVTCRVIAGMIAVVPLYIIGLLVSYLGSRIVTVYFYGQSGGTYDHYFTLFLPPGDILLSFLKVLFFAMLIMLVHCYYGFTAEGGPAGVGDAVGRAIRLSIVSVSVLDFFLSLAIWGSTTTVRIAG
ncbi:MlaE family ABC transporter permease [Jatrophihabitans endophyticus]|uniref:MlaE family ABC transporter permease n=1 Tax=Jatrophihabitans endophyticus TaxID=1206085 RepID=UPI0019DD64F5|nr:ABC transporter permease [Jatrophihabitans endophyticus]